MDDLPQSVDNIDSLASHIFLFSDINHFDYDNANTPDLELKSYEHDPEDINIVSVNLDDAEDWGFLDYLDISIKAGSIAIGAYTHPYTAASYALATATTALIALGSNYFESETFDYHAGNFLKVQNGFLKHVAMMGLLRDAKLSGSILNSIVDSTGLAGFENSWLKGLVANPILNVCSTFMGEAHADISNKLILENLTKGRLEMEMDDFWQYRAPLTVFKRLIKHSVGSLFDEKGLDWESQFGEWFSSITGIVEKDGYLKPFSILNHFAANLPVAWYYNGIDSYIFNRTLSHSVAKYMGEFSFNIFQNIGFDGLFSNFFSDNSGYIITKTDASKLLSLIVGSAGYSLSKEWWGNKPEPQN